MISKIQRHFSLTRLGAINLVKACISCTISYLTIAMSIGILYYFSNDMISSLVGSDVDMNVTKYMIEIIITLTLIYIAHYIQYNLTFYNTYKESTRNRVDLAQHLRLLPISYFLKRDVSDLSKTVLSDVGMLEHGLSHFIPEYIGSIISTLILSLLLLFIDIKMAIFALWCIPVSFIIIIVARKHLEKGNTVLQNKQRQRAFLIQEGLENVRDLKANSYVNHYLDEIDDSIDSCEKSQISNELTNALLITSSQLVLKLGIVTTLINGSYSLMNNQISFSTFLLFLLVTSRLYDPLNTTLNNLTAIISMKNNVNRLNEIKDYPCLTGLHDFHVDHYDIVFDRVSFGYDHDLKTIDDVSFIAHQGEITAIIGKSGSGKSTLSKLAARFYDPDLGRIYVGDQDIKEIDSETLLTKYAIVFQDVVLFNTSIMENIRIGKKDASDEEVLKAAKEAYVDEFVKDLPEGYQTVIGENGAKLSGGQRQRISIARAILKDAPIVIMDEATASLDVESETYVQLALSRLISNKTVIMIAHRMRTIASADHLIVLDQGKIVEEGKPEELLQQDSIYKHMAELQNITSKWQFK